MPRTLTQWMIVLVLGLMVIGAALAARSFLVSARDRSAARTIRAIERATQLYLNAHGVPADWRFVDPAASRADHSLRTIDDETYDALMAEFMRARLNLALPPNSRPDATIVDPWGRRFRISISQVDSSPRPHASSAGPDGAFDTGDDVR